MQEAEPNRSDYYAMQIAMEVRRVLSKHPGRIKLKDFKLRFEGAGEKKKVDYNKLAPYSIAAWKGVVMGMWNRMVKAREQPKPQPTPQPKPDRPILQRRRRGARK